MRPITALSALSAAALVAAGGWMEPVAPMWASDEPFLPAYATRKANPPKGGKSKAAGKRKAQHRARMKSRKASK